MRAQLEYEYKSAVSVLNDLVKRRYQKINSKYFESKYLEKIAQRASSYPKEVDPSVLVEKWTSIDELNRHIGDILLPVTEEESPIKVRGSLAVELELDQSASPSTVGSPAEEELSRQRTEMLLRVSQFRS